MSTAASTVPGRRSMYKSAKGQNGPFVKTKQIPLKEEETTSYTDEKQSFKTRNKTEKTKDIINDIHKGARKKSENYNRFMDLERVPPDNTNKINTNRADVDTTKNKGVVITSTKQYDTMVQEHIQLYQQHKTYKKQIKTLEEENAQLLMNFNSLYEENKKLGSKMGTVDGQQPSIEPYKRVYDDRRILRQAENNYKKRISQLEQEVKELQNTNTNLANELKVLNSKSSKLHEQLLTQAKLSHLHYECKRLRNENQDLRKNIAALTEGGTIQSSVNAPKLLPLGKPPHTTLTRKPPNTTPAVSWRGDKLKSEAHENIQRRLSKSNTSPPKLKTQNPATYQIISNKPFRRSERLDTIPMLPGKRELFAYEKTLPDSYYE